MKVVSLSMTLFCFALVTLISQTYATVVIFRGEKDRFTNASGCHNSKAVCFDSNCAECQCMVGQTFVQIRGKYGECVSNDLVVHATSYEATFLLQHDRAKNCLYQETRNTADGKSVKFVVRTYGQCNETSKNFRWLWTKFGQLLHWDTLECMSDDLQLYIRGTWYNFVVLKECYRNNQKQQWKCWRFNKKYIQLLVNPYKFDVYMDYGVNDYVTVRYRRFGTAQWTRYNTKNDICSEVVGCEIFAGGSSLIILNKTKCEEHSECSGEKEIDLTRSRCSILSNKTQYLHNDTWRALEMKNGSFEITADKPFLKWNLSETPKSWGGLMVKVQFKCEITSDPVSEVTEHCVVIKYTGTFKGFNLPYEDDNNKGSENHESEKNHPKTIIAVVGVLLVLVITGVIIFVIYRHRFVRSKKRNTESKDMKPKEEYASTSNPLYPRNNNQSGQTECALYESTPENVYQDLDADQNTADLSLQNFAYDYAMVDGPMNKDVMRSEGTPESNDEHQHDSQEQLGETMDTSESSKPPEHNYVVLEEP